MISRKSKHRRRACQLFLPVRKLAVQLARLQPFPLPGCKVRVLNRERRQRRFTAGCVRRVKLGEFLAQYSHRPAVGDQVMHDQQENVLFRSNRSKAAHEKENPE